MAVATEASNSALIAEMKGLREDLRSMTHEIGQMAGEVKHLARGQEQTAAYGERIRSLETDVANNKIIIANETADRMSAERSAATERRWVIATVLGVVLALIGFILTAWKHG